MKLAKFIERNMEAILVEWEAFARSLSVQTETMTAPQLRDHARTMLSAMTRDMSSYQSLRQQEDKGKGDAPVSPGFESAAASHGSDRHNTGFSLIELIAEFRAVRASVLRLWLPTLREMDHEVMDEMVRFNEAIDQAIAESVETFSAGIDTTRDTFLGMLGHDLRGPLHVMGMSAALLARVDADAGRRATAIARIARSTATMQDMVNDLLDFARARLGGSIPIAKRAGDLSRICAEALSDAVALHPSCAFDFSAPLPLPGLFDAPRLLQVVGNLLNNATQHCTKGTHVSLHVRADNGCHVIEVHNLGDAIPPELQEAIFQPLVQMALPSGHGRRTPMNVGLGLFIARKITESHGGTIAVDSSVSGGTRFTVRLPMDVTLDLEHGSG